MPLVFVTPQKGITRYATFDTVIVCGLIKNLHDCILYQQINNQEKHHMWVQTARLYLYLICILNNKNQNNGIFSKIIRKPEKVAKHT